MKSRRVAFDAGLESERSQVAETRRAAEIELAAVKSQTKEAEEGIRLGEADTLRKRGQLEDQFEAALAQYKKLQDEVNLLEENLEDISFGLYKPHFSFATSEEYKTALEQVRDQQRALIKSGNAAICGIEWTVSGSKQEGVRMQKQYLKLMLRSMESVTRPLPM